MVYTIAYTAPSGARGTLRVTADSADAAAAMAREIHTRRYPVTPALGWAGPGSHGTGTGTSRRQLPKNERDGMEYGAPVPFYLSDANAA